MRVIALYRMLTNSAASQRFIAFVVFASVASIGSTADYSGGFTMGVNTSHNDNLRMVNTDKTAVYHYQASPAITLNANTETSTLSLNTVLDFNRYNDSSFDSNDQNMALGYTHQFERSSIGINAAVVRQSTLTSERLGSGRIGNKADPNEQYQLSPNWSYTLNENNLIQLMGTYTIQEYHNTAYIGYKNAEAEADWIYIVNERVKLVSSATYSEYRSDDLTFEIPSQDFIARSPFNGQLFPFFKGQFGSQRYSTQTKNKRVQLGLDYQWAEQSLLQARIGRSKNTTTYPQKSTQNFCDDAVYQALAAANLIGGICNADQSQMLSTAQLNWTWSNERQKISLNSSKSTQPTSNGYAVDAIQVGANWGYSLTELDRISFDLSATRNRAIDTKASAQNTVIANRNYLAATIGYSHQVGEHWFLNASYQFNEQKYTQIDSQANSKVISLGIRYQPQQSHWSR